MFFEFNVSGWVNTQFVKANSEAQAFEAAVKIAAGENNLFGFRQIERNEAYGFIQDASLV